jgi:hypothetical protein
MSFESASVASAYAFAAEANNPALLSLSATASSSSVVIRSLPSSSFAFAGATVKGM